LGRNGKIQQWTTKKRIGNGASSTRPSIRNSRKYFRTSWTDGESGEPRLTSKTPCFLMPPRSHRIDPARCSLAESACLVSAGNLQRARPRSGRRRSNRPGKFHLENFPPE